MGITLIQNDDTEFVIDKIKFVKISSSFKVTDQKKNKINFFYPLKKEDSYKPEDFSIYLFHKPNCATNDIFQINVKDLENTSCRGKLGWIFPIQSLLSDQHDHAENPHFLPYAYNAYLALLNGLPEQNYYNKIKITEPEEKELIEKIYGENTIIMVLYKNYLIDYNKKFKEPFDIKKYTVTFFKNGYHLLSPNNFHLFNQKDFKTILIEKAPKNKRTKINIRKTSDDFFENEYINSLLLDLIPFQDHPLVKFHLLYQIIELLIDLIFKKELANSTKKFTNSDENFHEIKDEIMLLAKEQERITKLFNDYSKNVEHNFKDNLKKNCIELIKTTKDKIPDDAPKALYKIRCLLFHNLRALKPDYTKLLTNINNDFENLLMELLIEFRFPK